VVGALAIVEADYFDTAKLGDGTRFKFGAAEPATAEAAAVQVDQDLVLILGCDAVARCIHDRMHATDAGVFGGGGKQFALTGEISGEQHRHAVHLLQHLRVAQVLQMLVEVGAAFVAHQWRQRHCLRRHVHGTVGVERECVLCMQCLAQQQQRAAQQSA
jgi:hypothetical protein